MKQKLTALLLALVMLCALAPMAVLADGPDVAQSGGTAYQTLQEAINSGDGSVTLLANCTESVTIAKEQNITLDLAGFTLTNADGEHTITNCGTLTITGSGNVDNLSHGRSTVCNEPGGSVTLNGGSYTRTQENSRDNTYYTLINHGAMTINAPVSVTQNGNYSSMIENGWQDGSKNTDSVPSTLTITGGHFSGGLNTVKNDDWGQLTISGGTFKNASQATVLNWNTAVIEGGEFTANSDARSVLLNGQLNGTMDKGELTIRTGPAGDPTFTGDVPAIRQMDGTKPIGAVTILGGSFQTKTLVEVQDANTAQADDGVNVSGGSFNESTGSSLPESYLADGFTLTQNPDGSFGAQPKPVVAKIGSTDYYTLADALAALQDNQTLELIGTIEVDAPVALTQSGITVTGGTLKPSASFARDAVGTGSILNVTGKNVTLRGVTVDASGTRSLTGDNQTKYAVQFQSGTGLVDGCTIINDGWAGILVQGKGAELTISNTTFDLTGSSYAAVEYANRNSHDPGENPAGLTLSGTITVKGGVVGYLVWSDLEAGDSPEALPGAVNTSGISVPGYTLDANGKLVANSTQPPKPTAPPQQAPAPVLDSTPKTGDTGLGALLLLAGGALALLGFAAKRRQNA